MIIDYQKEKSKTAHKRSPGFVRFSIVIMPVPARFSMVIMPTLVRFPFYESNTETGTKTEHLSV